MKGLIGLAIGIVLATAVFVVNHFCFGMVFDGDSAGVLISALGVMVTALVGWQVFNAIEMRQCVKKMDDLEATLNARSVIFTNRNMQIQELIEGHASIREAEQRGAMASDSYLLYADALTHFLNSNVPLDYQPLQSAIVGLADTLIILESNNSPEEIDDFIERANEYEDAYHNVVAAIHRREEGVRNLHNTIIGQREERQEVIQRLLAMRNDNPDEPQSSSSDHPES